MLRFALAALFISIAATSSNAVDQVHDFTVRLNSIRTSYGQMSAALTVDNRNDFQIADVRFLCTFYARSGTELAARSFTIFDIFGPRSKRTVRHFAIGLAPDQVQTVACIETSARRT